MRGSSTARPRRFARNDASLKPTTNNLQLTTNNLLRSHPIKLSLKPRDGLLRPRMRALPPRFALFFHKIREVHPAVAHPLAEVIQCLRNPIEIEHRPQPIE